MTFDVFSGEQFQMRYRLFPIHSNAQKFAESFEHAEAAMRAIAKRPFASCFVPTLAQEVVVKWAR